MALKKCKECGHKISKKAKSCPSCGSPQGPKQYSLGKLLVLIVFGIFMYGVFTSDYSSSPTSTTAVDSSHSKPKKIVEIPTWRTLSSKDEMTGKLQAFASSPKTTAIKSMSFPYANVKSWIGVGCDGKKEWAYFGFTTAPNLTKSETKDGYNLIKTRMKWGDEIENATLIQEWGAKTLHFQYVDWATEKITSSDMALLELSWHGQQRPNFKYSLNGASEALVEIRKKCKSY